MNFPVVPVVQEILYSDMWPKTLFILTWSQSDDLIPLVKSVILTIDPALQIKLFAFSDSKLVQTFKKIIICFHYFVPFHGRITKNCLCLCLCS